MVKIRQSAVLQKMPSQVPGLYGLPKQQREPPPLLHHQVLGVDVLLMCRKTEARSIVRRSACGCSGRALRLRPARLACSVLV